MKTGWGLDRGGLWAQAFRDPGTGFGIMNTFLGFSVSVQVAGRGVLVGWMYRRPISVIAVPIEEE